MFRSALGAEPAEDELALAHDTLAKRVGGGLGQVVPGDVLDIAATVADEVVMPQARGIEARGAALDRYLAHQARLD